MALTAQEAPDGITGETVWAFALGDNRYRLDNIPIYCFGYSWHDIVDAAPLTPEDLPTVRQVITKSGHRTIRIAAQPAEQELAQTTLARLRKLGCTSENAFDHLYALDIPPSVDLFSVRALLIESGLTWEHADPTYDELFPDDKPDA